MCEDPPTMEKYWLRSLGLSSDDRECLHKDRWLTDRIIIAVGQNLLKPAHPQIRGLQFTTLGKVLGFANQEGDFVQISYTTGNHWVTFLNIGFKQDAIGIFDSKCTYVAPTRLKENIAAITHTSNSHLMLDYQNVQEQWGTSDCGLFVSVFATSLCAGKDPTTISYVQHQL